MSYLNIKDEENDEDPGSAKTLNQSGSITQRKQITSIKMLKELSKATSEDKDISEMSSISVEKSEVLSDEKFENEATSKSSIYKVGSHTDAIKQKLDQDKIKRNST